MYQNITSFGKLWKGKDFDLTVSKKNLEKILFMSFHVIYVHLRTIILLDRLKDFCQAIKGNNANISYILLL